MKWPNTMQVMQAYLQAHKRYKGWTVKVQESESAEDIFVCVSRGDCSGSRSTWRRAIAAYDAEQTISLFEKLADEAIAFARMGELGHSLINNVVRGQCGKWRKWAA